MNQTGEDSKLPVRVMVTMKTHLDVLTSPLIFYLSREVTGNVVNAAVVELVELRDEITRLTAENDQLRASIESRKAGGETQT